MFGRKQTPQPVYDSSESRLTIEPYGVDSYAGRVVGTVEADMEVFEDCANARIEVLGDVHGTVLAQGGGATVIVHGDVHPGARVGALGGGARIEIGGRVR